MYSPFLRIVLSEHNDSENGEWTTTFVTRKGHFSSVVTSPTLFGKLQKIFRKSIEWRKNQLKCIPANDSSGRLPMNGTKGSTREDYYNDMNAFRFI